MNGMDVAFQNGHENGDSDVRKVVRSENDSMSNGHDEDGLLNGLDSLFTSNDRRDMSGSADVDAATSEMTGTNDRKSKACSSSTIQNHGNADFNSADEQNDSTDSAESPGQKNNNSPSNDAKNAGSPDGFETSDAGATAKESPSPQGGLTKSCVKQEVKQSLDEKSDEVGKPASPTTPDNLPLQSDGIKTGCKNLDSLLSTKEKRSDFVEQLINDIQNSESSKSMGIADVISDNLKAFIITVAGPQTSLDELVGKLRDSLGVPDQIVIPPSEIVPMLAVSNHQGTARAIDKPVSDNANSPCFPCPAMTSVLMEIGLNLVMESQSVLMYEKMTKDIHSNSQKLKDVSKRLDDLHMGTTPADSDSDGEDNIDNAKKNKDTLQKSVATLTQNKQKLKTELVRLKDANRSFRLKTAKCQKCEFRTESLSVMFRHLLFPHRKLNRLECGFCDFRVADFGEISAHYQEEHGAPAYEYLYPSKFACDFCMSDDFTSKGAVRVHMRACAAQNPRHMNLAPVEDDLLHINRLFWGLNDSQLRRIQQRMFAARRQQQQVTQGADVKGQQMLRRPMVAARSGVSGATGLAGRPSDVILKNQAYANILPKPSVGGVKGMTSPPTSSAALQQQLNSRAAMLAAMNNQQNIRSMFNKQYSGRGRPPKMDVPAYRGIGRPPSIAPSTTVKIFNCEICDIVQQGFVQYSMHLQIVHGKHLSQDVNAPPPLSCSKCVNQRFYSYEGLERHLLAVHNLVSQELLRKAKEKKDGGRCKLCARVSFRSILLLHTVVSSVLLVIYSQRRHTFVLKRVFFYVET